LDYKYSFFQLERLGQPFISHLCDLSRTIVEIPKSLDLSFYPTKAKSLR
jgi:hypothetical protein